MKIIRFSQLQEMIPLSRTQIWRLENEGLFPKRFNLSKKTVGWDAAEIDEWLQQRKEASNA